MCGMADTRKYSLENMIDKHSEHVAHWNALEPGDRVATTKKLMQVGAIVGRNEKTGCNILRLHWVNGTSVSISGYETGNPLSYRILPRTIPNSQRIPKALPARGTRARRLKVWARLSKALRCGWSAFLAAWRSF